MVVFADKMPFDLEADYINISNDDSFIEAKGNVEVQYKGYSVQANQLYYSKNDGLLEFRDGVQLRDAQNNMLYSTSLLLNLNNDSTIIENGILKTYHQYYVAAEKIQLLPLSYVFSELTFTTCSNQHPHYHLHSSSLSYYRQTNALNINDSRLFFYGIPIFYFPQFSYNIQRDDQQQATPKIGYNLIDGTYGTLNFGYFLSEKSSGMYGIGISTNRGFRYGATHRYLPLPNHILEVSAYDVAETGFEGGLSYEWAYLIKKQSQDLISEYLSNSLEEDSMVLFQAHYLYDRIIYNELYHSHPELKLSYLRAPFFYDTLLDAELGGGYFEDRFAKDTRYMSKVMISKKIIQFSESSSLNSLSGFQAQVYASNVNWTRFYNQLSVTFSLFGFNTELSYLKLFVNDGYSPFIFDTLNEITDDEVSLITSVLLGRIDIELNLDYKINEASFRNLNYTIGWIVHCWQLNVHLDQRWNEISFGISIPNLN